MISSWGYYRDRWVSADAAVTDASRNAEGLAALKFHPTVVAALSSIDMAERAIAAIADEMLDKYYDGEEE